MATNNSLETPRVPAGPYVHSLNFLGQEDWENIGCEPDTATRPPKKEIPFLMQAKTKRLAQTGQLMESLKSAQNLETPEHALEVATLISEKVGQTVTAADVISMGVVNCIEELLYADGFQLSNFMDEVSFSVTKEAKLNNSPLNPSTEGTIVTVPETIGTRKEASLQHGDQFGNNRIDNNSKKNPAKSKIRRRARKESPRA